MEYCQGRRKTGLTLPPAQRIAHAQGSGQRWFLLVCVLTALFFAACTPRSRSGGAAALPRADPGYVQWLESQSMLGATQELISQVSGTDRLWANSATAERPDILRKAAPNWLFLNPHTSSKLRALTSSAFTGFMRQAGLTGVFLSPLDERGDVWASTATPHQQTTDIPITALALDPAVGTQEDLSKLTAKLESISIQMGGNLLPAATGLGPDFMLQARKVNRFDGLYAMLPVAPTQWQLLPAATEAWDCHPLTQEMVATLRQHNLPLQELERDHLDWIRRSGWAATGPVLGVDGQTRRWLYRYSGSALRPVLLWQDPSGQARRIFSAAIIRHTGLQRQTLAGLRLEALMGMDVQNTTGQSSARRKLFPGLDALDALAGEVHRYGGWAVQSDILPPSLTSAALGTAVDFQRDSIVPAAAALALLTGDATPLDSLLRKALAEGVDFRRLARGLDDGLYMDWRPLLDLPNGRALLEQATAASASTTQQAEVPASLAFLAAQALHLEPRAAMREEHADAMQAACLLLLSWRLGLPGLAFISPADLTGALVGANSGTDGSLRIPLLATDPQGATVPQVFGSLDTQAKKSHNFAATVAHMLRQRQQHDLANGRLKRVQMGPAGCLQALTTLPDGNYWLLLANFSDQKKRVRCALPPGTTAAYDIFEKNLPLDARGQDMDIDARHARHILLTVTSSSQGARP